MRSTRKILVNVEPVTIAGDTKPWAVVRSIGGEVLLIPSFEDLFRVVLAIVQCENEKYPDIGRPPSAMVRRFLNRSIDAAEAVKAKHGTVYPLPESLYEAVWARLAGEFLMPRRAGGTRDLETENCKPGCACDLCAQYPLEITRKAS